MTKQQQKAEERREKVRKLALDGLGNQAIAARLGMTANTVGDIRRQLGLSRGRTGAAELAAGLP